MYTDRQTLNSGSYLRRVYESNQYGQVNVMDGLADLIGPDLGLCPQKRQWVLR